MNAQSMGSKTPAVFYFFNRFDELSSNDQQARAFVARQCGHRLLPITLRHSVEMAEALRGGISGADLTPGSELSHDYLELALWVRRVAPLSSAVLLARAMERAMRGLRSTVGAAGNRSGVVGRLARLLIYALLLFLALNCITVDFKWPEQMVLGTLTIALAFVIHGIADTELVTLALMFASMLATARYAYWRCSSVFDAAVDPGQQVGKIDLAFMLILLSAEIYAFVILYPRLHSNHPPSAQAPCRPAARR